MSVVPLQGFAPDMDPLTPGIFVQTDQLIPTDRGFIPMPQLQQLFPPLPSASRMGYVARYLDGTQKIFAGTATKLYRAINGAWTDVSRSSRAGATASAGPMRMAWRAKGRGCWSPRSTRRRAMSWRQN